MHLMSVQLEPVDPIALTSLNKGNNKQIVIGHVPFISISFNISLKIIW